MLQSSMYTVWHFFTFNFPPRGASERTNEYYEPVQMAITVANVDLALADLALLKYGAPCEKGAGLSLKTHKSPTI